jgi:hypothetical protein
MNLPDISCFHDAFQFGLAIHRARRAGKGDSAEIWFRILLRLNEWTSGTIQ